MNFFQNKNLPLILLMLALLFLFFRKSDGFTTTTSIPDNVKGSFRNTCDTQKGYISNNKINLSCTRSNENFDFSGCRKDSNRNVYLKAIEGRLSCDDDAAKWADAKIEILEVYWKEINKSLSNDISSTQKAVNSKIKDLLNIKFITNNGRLLNYTYNAGDLVHKYKFTDIAPNKLKDLTIKYKIGNFDPAKYSMKENDNIYINLE